MKISIIGLGKLGLCLAGVFADAGHKVLGIDVSGKAVEAARRGEPLVPEPGLPELLKRNHRRMKFQTLFDGLRDTAMSFIIVPTPTPPGEEKFSNDYVLAALNRMGPELQAAKGYHVVVLVSTVMPRASQDVIIPVLERAAGKAVGFQMGYCYSPEFIALGNVIDGMQHPDILLIGESDKRAGDALLGVLCSVSPDAPAHRMAPLEAEVAKLCLNVALSSRITFANMVGRLADVLDVDAHRILGAITGDSRIGKKFMRPGAPVSGPCLPRDLIALNRALKDFGVQSELPGAMVNENALLIHYIVQRMQSFGVKTVGILGWSYKPGTPLTDESAAFPLAELLLEAGLRVVGYDPMAEIGIPDIIVADSAEGCVEQADAVYVHTPWPEFADVPAGVLKGKKIIDFWKILKA